MSDLRVPCLYPHLFNKSNNFDLQIICCSVEHWVFSLVDCGLNYDGHGALACV